MVHHDPSQALGGRAPGESDRGASERHLRLVLASVADVVIEVDPDNTFRWVSPSVAHILGWDPEELVGKSAVDIVHSEDLGELIQAREHPVDGVAHGIYRVRTGRGVYRWMSGQSREVRDRGRMLGRVVTLRDVDGQVRARQALADSEARYRLLAENSSDVVFEGGNDGRVRWVSQSVTDLLGWTPDELVGATFRHLVHPDDLPRVMEVQRGLLDGEPGRMRIRVRTVTGDFRWFDCSIRPVFDDSGNVIGRVGGWRDVQAEQVAQESLRVSEARYRLIAENVGDVVITTAPDLTVTWVSPALPRLSGWTSSDILGRSVWDFVHPDDVDALTAALSELQRGGVESVTMRARFRHRDGSYQHWSVVSRLADGKAGAGLVVSLRNVNDQ